MTFTAMRPDCDLAKGREVSDAGSLIIDHKSSPQQIHVARGGAEVQPIRRLPRRLGSGLLLYPLRSGGRPVEVKFGCCAWPRRPIFHLWSGAVSLF